MQLYLFDDTTLENLIWEDFRQTDLGQLYLTIPLEKLSKKFPSKQSGVGNPGFFTVKGALGLMFLKHKLRLSDEMLLSRLNTDWAMQLFCGIKLRVGQRIKDKDLVWRWRKWFGQHMDLKSFQGLLAKEWKVELKDTNVGTSDATCYESYIRYPTDVKLLWESCHWLNGQIIELYKYCGLRKPRYKFKEQKQKYLAYAKLKKKSHKKTRARIKSLLYLSNKLLGLLELVLFNYQKELKSVLNERFVQYLSTIQKVYEQQQRMFDEPDYKPKKRIVSIAKPYLRPIVRGKENKRVEFGAKVNKIQIDGISFIEHLSFNAFNEGIRLQSSIALHRSYFGKCTHFAADDIYATNANRSYCTKQGIVTNFKPKGRKAKDEKQRRKMRSILSKERATRLEGSFGNEKNHYLLAKVKARTQETEIAWIVFGMMTANASIICKRKNAPPKKKAA